MNYLVTCSCRNVIRAALVPSVKIHVRPKEQRHLHLGFKLVAKLELTWLLSGNIEG